MDTFVSTDKIMEQIKSEADERRKQDGFSGASSDGITLKAHIDEAARSYAYRYGDFPGGGIKRVVKKILSLIIRPAVRPLLIDQTEFNRNLVQELNQIQLSMNADSREDFKSIEKGIVHHENEIKKMGTRMERLDKMLSLCLIVSGITLAGLTMSGCSNFHSGDKQITDSSSVEQVENIESDVAVIGHRGYPVVKPENTLSSFLAAKDIGVDYIELDVQKTSDSEIVIFHDNTMARVTGAEGTIGDYTRAQLQEMDAGSFFSADCAGEKIPTLSEALLLVKGELPGYESIRSTARDELKVYLELKDIGDDNAFVEQVVSIVEECGLSERVVYASFNYDYIKHIKEMDESNQVLYNTSSGKLTLPDEYPADFYGINMQAVNAGTIKAIHDAGKKVFVWTVDTASAMKNVIHMGADGIVTNDSGMAMVAVNSRFEDSLGNLEKTYILPWLYNWDMIDADYIAQGFANCGGVLAVSAYDKTSQKNSVVYLMNQKGAFIRKVDMHTMAHVGGLAFDEANNILWITGPDGHVLAAPWDEVLDGTFAGEYINDFDAELVNHSNYKVASFIGMYSGALYVGSYTIGMKGKLRKYDVSDPLNPALVYEAEIPECIQGMTAYYDNVEDTEYLILSQSHEMDDAHLLTFKYDESIQKYEEPLTTELLPEGTEGIQMTADGLYVLFESGSRPYRETAIVPNDKLYLLRR